MRIPSVGLIIFVGILSASCAQKSLVPTSFAPAYKTMLDASDAVVVRNCAAISSVSAENGLNGSVVGKRTLEDSNFPPQTISMDGDAAGWVRSAADEMFKRAMLKTSVASAPSVKLRLAEIQINENVHVNAGYDARVTIDASLLNAQGQECWTARKSGTSQDYGNHGTAENYRAVVNHALDRAIMAVASDSAFQDVLCHNGCPVKEAAPSTPSPKKHWSKRRK